MTKCTCFPGEWGPFKLVVHAQPGTLRLALGRLHPAGALRGQLEITAQTYCRRARYREYFQLFQLGSLGRLSSAPS